MKESFFFELGNVILDNVYTYFHDFHFMTHDNSHKHLVLLHPSDNRW